MNNNNIIKIWNDFRGNKCIQMKFDKNEQKFLNNVRNNWMKVSDDEIAKSKQIILDIFGDINEVKGTPYVDFIHLFNSNNNYFVLTDIYKDPIVLKYEGECDMHLNPNISFEEMQMFI